MSITKINSSQFYFDVLIFSLFINYHYLLCYLLFIVIECSDHGVSNCMSALCAKDLNSNPPRTYQILFDRHLSKGNGKLP